MSEKKKEKLKNQKYCPECGIIEGSEPFGVRCNMPECPNNYDREKKDAKQV